MHEPRLAIAEPAQHSAAERLGIAIAMLAGRLADFLAQLSQTARDALSDDVAFLRAMAGAYSANSPHSGVHGSFWPPARDPIDRLIAGLDLSPLEADLLLLAGLAEAHEGFARLLRALHPRSEPRPTLGLAAQLFCSGPNERRMLHQIVEHGAAARSGALAIAGEGPFYERTIALAEALWPVLNGLDVWPDSLPRKSTPTPVTGLEDWMATRAATRARRACLSGEPRLIVVFAESEMIAAERACALALLADAPFVRIVLPMNCGEAVEKLLAVHALARGVLPIVQLAPADTAAAHGIPEFRYYPGPVIVCTRMGGAIFAGARPAITLRAERLTPAARGRLWRETLPELAEFAPLLAARYTIEPATAVQVAADVRSNSEIDDSPIGLAEVARSVRIRCNANVSSNVKLVRPVARWNDLILPDDRVAQLNEALDRLVHQARVIDEWGFLASRPGARGVRMLFSGPPGTGKSLSAEVMAHRLGVDLLVVDIARLVSKWLGETEKNLAEVFDAAERMQVVLLFDEADALFGKRTEISDAHDRYANLETAYLLSRLERFEGLAILSTNLRQNIDPAFIRRLEFVVEFDEPSANQREALWRRHLPPTAPLADDVRLDELAALYPIVGGLIRNAATAAGFLAAAAGTSITRHHLERAVWREYVKTSRAFPSTQPNTTSQ
jgi:hypothetical protein